MDIDTASIEEIKNLHKETYSVFATGDAGGGFVKVTVNGHFQIIQIEYEDSPLIKEDIKMYNDLLIAAFNVAVEKVKDKVAIFIARYKKQ
jgi:DNA-binding YbaB/EbfC family protein